MPVGAPGVDNGRDDGAGEYLVTEAGLPFLLEVTGDVKGEMLDRLDTRFKKAVARGRMVLNGFGPTRATGAIFSSFSGARLPGVLLFCCCCRTALRSARLSLNERRGRKDASISTRREKGLGLLGLNEKRDKARDEITEARGMGRCKTTLLLATDFINVSFRS